MNIAREIRARKAKFGFDLGGIGLHNVVEMGRFVEAFQSAFDDSRYVMEESGWNPSTVVKIYTEEDDVADFIRNYTA